MSGHLPERTTLQDSQTDPFLYRMALLASPDVGVRGRPLLKNRRRPRSSIVVKRGRAAVRACPRDSSAGIVGNMTASTVAQYLAALPADRRAALGAVRKAINENLPDGYEEGMQFGMIGW
jgi:hypothetical protein